MFREDDPSPKDIDWDNFHGGGKSDDPKDAVRRLDYATTAVLDLLFGIQDLFRGKVPSAPREGRSLIVGDVEASRFFDFATKFARVSKLMGWWIDQGLAEFGKVSHIFLTNENECHYYLVLIVADGLYDFMLGRVEIVPPYIKPQRWNQDGDFKIEDVYDLIPKLEIEVSKFAWMYYERLVVRLEGERQRALNSIAPSGSRNIPVKSDGTRQSLRPQSKMEWPDNGVSPPEAYKWGPRRGTWVDLAKRCYNDESADYRTLQRNCNKKNSTWWVRRGLKQSLQEIFFVSPKALHAYDEYTSKEGKSTT